MTRGSNTVFFIMIIFIYGYSYGQESSKWEVAKEKHEVKISYRWLTNVENQRAREMKAEFEISAGIPQILMQFKDPLRYQQ